MKNYSLLYLSLCLLFSCQSYGQRNNAEQIMNSNAAGTAPDKRAIFDVQPTQVQQVLVPRMTSIQRTAISKATAGLLVFDTDTAGFWFYNGTAWVDLVATVRSDSGLPGDHTWAEEEFGATAIMPMPQLEVDGDIHLTNVADLNHFIGVPDMNGNNGNLTIHAAGQPGVDTTGAFQGGNLILSAGNLNSNGSSNNESGSIEIIAGKNMFDDDHHGDILFKGGNNQLELVRIDGDTGNMGIGTSTPTSRLHIAGNIKIADGSQVAGNVLTSDANGLASWQPVASSFEIQDELEFVLLAGGSFEMGCTSEQTGCTGNHDAVHTVILSPFRISKYEVTNVQYAAFLNTNGNQMEGGVRWMDIGDVNARISLNGAIYTADAGFEDHPVVEVTWYGARAFALWMGGRLPTEAEWEYAARGGSAATPTQYSGSNAIDNVAWYNTNSEGTTHAVGTKQANELGLHDMSGNVLEWCNDRFGSTYYDSSPETNPPGPATGTNRVIRGGSSDSDASYCRVASRGFFFPGSSFYGCGFRVVLP